LQLTLEAKFKWLVSASFCLQRTDSAIEAQLAGSNILAFAKDIFLKHADDYVDAQLGLPPAETTTVICRGFATYLTRV